MRKLLTSITFGICCILSWVMAGMILEEDKAILKQEEVAMETLRASNIETSAQEALTPVLNIEKDLEKEQL